MIRTFEQSSNRLWVSQGFSLGPLSARRAEGATALPKASFTVEQSSTAPQTGAKRPEYTQKSSKTRCQAPLRSKSAATATIQTTSTTYQVAD
jgi:hypothetical protein